MFSVLGFMSNVHHTPISEVADEGNGRNLLIRCSCPLQICLQGVQSLGQYNVSDWATNMPSVSRFTDEPLDKKTVEIHPANKKAHCILPDARDTQGDLKR